MMPGIDPQKLATIQHLEILSLVILMIFCVLTAHHRQIAKIATAAWKNIQIRQRK